MNKMKDEQQVKRIVITIHEDGFESLMTAENMSSTYEVIGALKFHHDKLIEDATLKGVQNHIYNHRIT